MKLLFGLLILINIAFFLWNSSDRGVDEGQRRQSVHEDEVRLVDEDSGHASLDEVMARGTPQIKPAPIDSASEKPADKPAAQPGSASQLAETGNPARSAETATDRTDASGKGETPAVAPPTAESAAAAAVASRPAADAVAPAAASSKPAPAVQPAARECRTFGPYKDKSSAKKKLASLQKQGEAASIVSASKSAGIKNRYRVFQGPFSSSGMARARRDSLTRKGIKEHFARKNSGGKYIVSLGVFSTRDKADRLVAALGKKGENAKIRTEKITGQSVVEYRVKTAACK